MPINLLSDSRHYWRCIENIAKHHGLYLKEIKGENEWIGAEIDAEKHEKDYQKLEAIPLRMAGALFYLKQDLYEDAAYQLSRAGRDATTTTNQLLCGELRHIGAILFLHIMEAEGFPKGDQDGRIRNLAENVCYGMLYAAEAYLKEGNHERVGKRCHWRFDSMGRSIGFSKKNIKLPFRNIIRNCPDLEDAVQRYCSDMSLTL